jgi:hypothetical protein
MRTVRCASIALAVAALCLTVIGPALASRSATPSQAAALTRAVRISAVGGIDKVPVDRYKVSRVKISTVSKAWAMASLVPTKAFVRTFQPAYVVAVKLAGTSAWVVVDLGSAEVGCGIAPDSVLSDLLGLKPGEQPCPVGQGIS